MATESGVHGSTELLRDPTGEVVFQAGAYADEWVLGDARNATATADAAGRITDLVDYSDFGAAGFESSGWGSLVGNDGQPGDVTLGLDHYYARDYDTATGSWVQPDQWRGLLVRPQSLNRYAYVENDPVGLSDYLGYAARKAGKKNDRVWGGLAAGVKKAQVIAGLRATNPERPISGAHVPRGIAKPTASSVRSKTTLSRGGGRPGSGVSTPTSRSGRFTSIRHAGPSGQEDCAPGQTYIEGQYTDACHSTAVLEENRQRERDFWNGVAEVWESVSVSFSGCFFLCFEVGFGGGITIGVGAGPRGGLDIAVGGGGGSDGLSGKVQCSAAAGIGVYGELGGTLGTGPFSGAGVLFGGGIGCAGVVQYRFF